MYPLVGTEIINNGYNRSFQKKYLLCEDRKLRLPQPFSLKKTETGRYEQNAMNKIIFESFAS
jgi:hypothetical protein